MRALTIPGVETVHARESWEGNTTPISGNGYFAPTYYPAKITHARGHYTAADNLPNGGIGPNEDIPAVLRFLQSTNRAYRLHRKYSFGYSFAFDYLGGVWEGRGFDYRSAANNGDKGAYKAINLNVETLTLLFLVDGQEAPTELAEASARAVMREGHRRTLAAGGAPWRHRSIMPHSESDYTACPGVGISRRIAEGHISLDYAEPVINPEPLKEQPRMFFARYAFAKPGDRDELFVVTSAKHVTGAERDALIALGVTERVDVSGDTYEQLKRTAS